MLEFTGERIVPGAQNCEPLFAEKMYVEHSARYYFAAQIAVGARVLDVGCGVGYGSKLLVEAGAHEVVAFDLSSDAIEHAKAYYTHPNIRFAVGDATRFDFGCGFDLVTCFELIEHVDRQNDVLECISRALGSDGVLVISTPRALDAKRNNFHTQEFTVLQYRSLLERHFAHFNFYVENNHFCSLITQKAPAKC